MVLSQAEQLARDFGNIARETREVQTDIDRNLGAHVERINSLAAVIADANARVGSIEAVGRTANDNRDQRDNAVRELATLIDVRDVQRYRRQRSSWQMVFPSYKVRLRLN